MKENFNLTYLGLFPLGKSPSGKGMDIKMKLSLNTQQRPFTGNTLKMIAIAAMLLDHVAYAFLAADSVPAMLLHTVGKITGPIMFYFIAEGNHYSRNRRKYAERLIVFALISHIPYNLFFGGGRLTLLPTSVIFTLLCGLLALIVFEKTENKLLKWTLIVLLTGVTLWSDWSLWGVLFILCFGIYYGDAKKQMISYLGVNVLKVVWTVFFSGGNLYAVLPVIVSPFLVVSLLWLYNGTRGGNRYSKWAFYIVYPLQFIIIGGIRLFLSSLIA